MIEQSIPEVSVVFPVYNVREYVANSLGTIQDQTVQNIEIICVIDGATDDSAEIIESTFNDPRIRIIRQENRGLGGARNTGIRAARAPWVTFIDSDDWVHPRYIEALLTKARDGYDIVDSLHNVVDQFGSVTEKRQHAIDDTYDPATYFRQVIAARVPTNAAARLYRTSLFTDNDIYFPENTIHEDVFTVWKLYQKAAKAVTVPETLYNWFARTGSLSRTISKDHIADVFRSFEDTERALLATGELDASISAFYRRCYHFTVGLTNRIDRLKETDLPLHAELIADVAARVRASRYFHSKSLASVLKADPQLADRFGRFYNVDVNVMNLAAVAEAKPEWFKKPLAKRKLELVNAADLAKLRKDLEAAKKDRDAAKKAAVAPQVVVVREPNPPGYDPRYNMTFSGLLFVLARGVRNIFRPRRAVAAPAKTAAPANTPADNPASRAA